MMRRHTSIIQLGVALGYFKNTSGVCHGVTMAWIEACFSGEESVFNQRVEKICQFNSAAVFIEQLNAIKDKVKQREALSPQEQEVLDVIAFFEKIALYQDPDVHKAVLDERLGQSDQEKISKIIAADTIQAKGGIATVLSDNGIYQVEELAKYLSDIASAIGKSNPSSNDEVSVMLHAPDHTMALVYERPQLQDRITSCWRFMDINRPSSALMDIKNTDSIIEYIRSNYFDEKDQYIPLGLTIITTELNPYKDALIHDIHSVKVSSSITLDKLDSRLVSGISGRFSLAKQALFAGNTKILEQLELRDIEEMLSIDYIHPRSLLYLINKTNNTKMLSKILYKAAELDFPNVIEACASQMNLDIPFESYSPAPPLFSASMKGNVNAMVAFHNHGARLDRTSLTDTNLAHVAAQNGHEHVIAWLAKNQPALLTQRDTKGESPADVAAEMGYEAVLREIVKSNALSTDDWTKLLLISAQKGHTHLISFFIEQGVNLNLANESGFGAAHVAAYTGNIEFISELIRHGVDFCAQTIDGQTPLTMAAKQQPEWPRAKKKSPETIKAITVLIEAHVESKKNQTIALSNKFITAKYDMKVIKQENKQDITKDHLDPRASKS